MSDEQEVKERSQNKLIFVNCVDGFVGQNLAKYLSRCVVGASAGEMEEEEEEEEEHEDKEPVEPPADQVYHVIGSMKDKNKPKPGFVKDVVLFDSKDILYTYLIACDIIIYDISEYPDQSDEAAWVATQLASDVDKFDKSRPKTFILISSVLSWARTKPSDGEEAVVPLTEDDFRRRKGHPTYKDQLNAEKAVLKLAKIGRSKLVMYVVTAGLTYGAEEGIFHYLFKAGWHNSPDVPCLGDGRNILPTIHIRDLAAVIQNLADNRPKSRYIVAVDDSNNTLREITKVVSKSLTTGKVRILKEEEALLDRDRKQSDFDQLTVNLHLDPVSIKEMHIRWSAEAGLVENIDRIIREYRESRQLVPIKVLLLGPPAAGKSTVAQQLCQMYKLHHVRIKDVIDEAIGKMQKAMASRSEKKDEDAEEGEDEEEAEEEDDEDRDQPGDYESLLEAINESREQNNGKIEDGLVIPMFREKLRSKPCQNQGFVLDGFPKTIDQAKELFLSEDAEVEGVGPVGRGAYDSLILPDLIVCLEATDGFLRQRVLNLPENVVIGTHYTEHGMTHCLGEYRALNAEGEETVVSFFEEIEVPIDFIDVTKDLSVKMKDTVEKIKKLMGNPRNYGMTSEEEEETRSGDTEARIKKEVGEKAEREKLEAEESVNRKRRQDEWAKRLEEVKMEEQELLEAKATPLRNYLMKHVMPTLTRALIDCVKVRPEDAIDVIMSQEEEEVEDISPLQSQLLFSQPLTDTQTSDFEAAPVDQISSPLLHESENLTRSLSQSSHEVQAEQVDNQKNRSQTKLDKQPFSGMISLTATLSFLILCGLCLSVSDAQQCKADQKTCSTDGPARLDICQPHRTTAELFKITSVGTEIFTSGVCRCRLSNLMANGGFGIVVNNFSCPVNGCPWRLQIIVNGCLKAQFCCTDIWKGYEILYFQPTDHVTSVSLQIAQLAEPPEEFGTVSVAIRFDGHKRRLAQMTCGITTFGKSLKKCAPMPELKHAPESFVPVRQQENMMVLDICKPACSSQNPMTFGMNVGALHGPLVCSSKVSAVVSPNVFKVTISEFVCLNRCSYQLMIIIGPCIVQTFCCNIEWQPLTKMIENVNNEAVVQVSKSVDEPEALTFSLTILVGDGTARPVSMASFQSGYTNTSTAAFCHLLTGSTAASTFRQTKAEETVSQNTSGPFDGAVTDDRSAEGQRANVASGMSGGTPVPLEQRLWSVIFLRILQLIAFCGGGGSALRLIKKLIHAFGIDQNGPMQNTLAAAMNHYVTNNPGSLIDKAFRSMQSVAANGYGVVKGIIVFLCGGFVCVYIFNLATASAAFIASKFGWW